MRRIFIPFLHFLRTRAYRDILIEGLLKYNFVYAYAFIQKKNAKNQ